MKKVVLISALFVTSILQGQEKIFTLMNEKGERLCSVMAKSVGKFECGRAEITRAITKGDKSYYMSGFIDTTGKLVIECKYDKAYPFADDVTWVNENGDKKYFMIDKNGNRVGTSSWKKVGYFHDGMCAVYDDRDYMGFVNNKGELVIPCKYFGDGFSEGYACVAEMDSKTQPYGYIDKTGKAVIPFQYYQAGTSSFENGECRVQIKGVTNLINKKGEVVFTPTLTKNCMGFYNGLSASYTNYDKRSGWGYYNRKNQWVIKPQFDNANSFKGGYAVVEKGGKQGVIDTTGKFLIPMKYASIYSIAPESGYYACQLAANGEAEYFNAKGEPFTKEPVKYLVHPNGHSIIPYCDQNGKWGYMNKDGTVFIKAQFDRTSALSEHKGWINGDAPALKNAAGVSNSNFATEYKVGDKVLGNWKNQGKWYPGVIAEIGKTFYLVHYDDGDKEWVAYGSLKLAK